MVILTPMCFDCVGILNGFAEGWIARCKSRAADAALNYVNNGQGGFKKASKKKKADVSEMVQKLGGHVQ